jgi:hypothetical protein
MKRYEYIVKKISKYVEETLCEMGKHGWRLVTVDNQTFYFVRDTKGDE